MDIECVSGSLATSMSSAECEALSQEVHYLHRQLFRRDPPPVVIGGYLRAHAEILELRNADPRQLHTVNAIVANRLDALGIEVWLRGGRPCHALTSKLLLLAYLAECDASHPEFLRRAAGLVSSMNAVLLAVFRLLRGFIQKTWYGLV